MLQALIVTDLIKTVNVDAKVNGGGTTGQIGALRTAIAKAVSKLDDEKYRTILRPFRLLTTDSRRVERKKPGQAKVNIIR